MCFYNIPAHASYLRARRGGFFAFFAVKSACKRKISAPISASTIPYC